MNDQSGNLVNTAIDAASNPKVGVAVGSGSVAASVAVNQGLITGWLANFTTVLGFLAAALVVGVQAVKLIRELVGLRKDLKDEKEE